MRRCAYCGKDNEDTLPSCSGCGTPFSMEGPGTTTALSQALRTPLGLSITTALGILLTFSALFFIVGAMAVDTGILPGKPPRQYSGTYTLYFSRLPAPYIVLAAILPIFALCRSRCQRRFQASATACVTLLALAALALVPRTIPAVSVLWSPSGLLFLGSGFHGGCYIGAGLQLALGACLLVWFRPPRNDDETFAA